MNNRSDHALCRKASEKLRALLGYQLRHKYDMSLWVYSDEKETTPECAHRWTGDSRHHIWKIVALAGGLLLLIGLLRALCRLLRRI